MLKKIVTRTALCIFLLGLAQVGFAAELKISVEVPKLTVAEYHAPYTAIWIESSGEGDKKFVKTLAVWFDSKQKNEEGHKWLKDIRQWWRRDGRNLDLPIDGVSGATKLSGTHELTFTLGTAPLTELPAGQYQLFVEMPREVGGREVVKIPFSWPVTQSQNLTTQGATEVGRVALVINP